MKKSPIKFHVLSVFTIAMLASGMANAAGYKIEFNSASTLADQGDAAVAEDAGTNWYNSAGLVYVSQQLALSGFDVYAPVKFHGNTASPAAPALGVPGYAGSGTATSNPNQLIPALHYSKPYGKNFAFGISVLPAWGFSEDYGITSIVRYNLWRINTKSLDVAPSVAMSLSDQWSFGIGPDFHFFSVWSRNSVQTPLADSTSTFSASDWALGGHAGLMFKLDDATRFGLNYRSQIRMRLDGDSEFFFGTTNTNLKTENFTINVPLPAVTTFSAYRDITSRWAMMGSLNYDQWSVLNRYSATNLMSPTGPVASVILPQNMRNTLDIGVGTHLKVTEQLTLKGGVKYLPTPTNNSYRGINFPDGYNKIGVQVGGRYQYSNNIALDGIYGHVFIKQAQINDRNPVTGATANGYVNSSADFIGGQLIWTI